MVDFTTKYDEYDFDEAWAKSNRVNSHNGILTTNSGAADGINLQTRTTQNLSSLVSGSTPIWTYVGQSGTSDPVVDTWHHLTVTHDSGLGSNQSKFDVDGVLVDTDTQDLEYDGSTADALIGSFYTGAGNLRINSIIDEVRHSNTVRSDGWIAALLQLVNNLGTFIDFGELIAPVPEPSSFLLLRLGASHPAT